MADEVRREATNGSRRLRRVPSPPSAVRRGNGRFAEDRVKVAKRRYHHHCDYRHRYPHMFDIMPGDLFSTGFIWAHGVRGARVARRLVPLLALVSFNSIVGLIFWAGHRSDAVLPYLIVANGIGLSAWLMSVVAGKLQHGRIGLLPRVLFIAPASVLIGFELAASTVGGVPRLLGHPSAGVWLAHGTSFIVAGMACAFVSVYMHAERMRASLETQRREAAEARQAETAARLALLQAQIEPHFLFNTLANVQSLIEHDPERAEAMLSNLNQYLRASLGRTRKTVSTLGEELDLVEALLEIAAIRLGERLRYDIDIPAPLRALTLPPLLLQPLVENAILHGIEPSIAGGSIHIRGGAEGGILRLSVVDSGMGLNAEGPKLHVGVGLANVRARLKSLYGDRAGVWIGANADATSGVAAHLSIPISTDADCPHC